MANDIVLGAAMRSNLLSLQNTQRSIDSTQLRLATGKKVNSALDNPQSFFQAQSLNNRASDLTRLLDGIGQSIRTLEEADKGVTALTNLVSQAQSIAEEAQSEIRAAEGFASVTGTVDLRDVTDLTASGAITANDDVVISFYSPDDGVVTSGDINIAAGDTVYDLVANINSNAAIQDYVRASVDSSGRLKLESLEEGGMIRIADGTTTPGADGYAYLGLDSVVTTENNNTVAPGSRQAGTIVAGRILTSDESAGTPVNGEYLASDTLATAGFISGFATGGADDLTIQIRVDNDTVTLGNTYTDATTIQEVLDDINTSSLSDKVTARFNTDTGRIELEFADDVTSAEVVFQAEAAGTINFGFGTAATDVAIGAAGALVSEAFTFVGSSANLTQYRDDYNNIRDQIDGLVEDANYRGVNLLGGDNLTTFFNEDRSNSLVTEGVDFSALGLGLAEVDFIDAGDVEEAISQTRSALESVRAFGSSIANDLSIIQTRRDFTEQTINTLKAGASDLTDADLNEEGANLLALQTAQQLGVTSLSLASQSQQSVLRLF